VTMLAQLSDLHLDGGQRNVERTSRALDHLAALSTPVDAVLITGDITNSGAAADYVVATELTSKLNTPVLFCPGNHDDRATFASILLGLPNHTGPINQVHELTNASILLCDSTIPGQPAGALDADTLMWLDNALTGPTDRPAFVVLHHPPVPLGIPELDTIGLRNADDFKATIQRHPRIAGILCGHAHTAAASTFAGIPLRVAPSVASTAVLPCERTATGTMDFNLPVALAFHSHVDGLLTTHFRAL
jgi:3',5'-cyclic-AMP phosphodiesterase